MRRLPLAVLAAGYIASFPRLAAATEAVAPTGYASLLIQTTFVLGGVCLLAFVSLKWGLKRFVAPEQAGDGAMRVLGRLPVEPRRSIVVVRVAGRHLLLGSSEAGIQPLGELTEDEAAVFESKTPTPRSFADVFAAIRPNVSRETIAGEER